MQIFGGLEIGKRSIMTHQAALNVTGHNVASVNTPGYTRQSPNIVTTRPWHTPMLTGNSQVGQFGTGVDVASIDRLRDTFLDGQIRQENRTSGYWTSMQESLARIEVILNEPSKTGLRGVMDQFWESWQDLSAHPESEAVRSVVAQRGLTVAEAFRHTHQQLSDLREDVNANVRIKVDEINSISQQLCDLNKQILSISVAGKQPNDLLDKRDLLLDQLSKIVDINVYQENNIINETNGKVMHFSGMITVQMGGRTLVQGAEFNKLDTARDQKGMHMVIWQDTKVRAQISGGELRGLLDTRGRTDLPTDSSEYKEIIPNMLTELNTLAKTIVTKTNELHRQGYSLNNNDSTKYKNPDGINFFTMPDEPIDSFINWAKMMNVDEDIYKDPKNIAAAASPTWDAAGNKTNFGDGAKALEIAGLKHSLNSTSKKITTKGIPLPIAGKEIQFDLLYGGKATKVNFTAAATYADLQAFASDVEDHIKTAMNLTNSIIKVEADANGKLTFSSADNSFQGINDLQIGTDKLGDYLSLTIKDATTDDYWRATCADVGVISQEATRMVKNQAVLLNQLENKRQSLSGVSLDEEMTNMIKFQHAYVAASRFINAIDEELEVIVNRLGLVGR